MHQGWMLRTNDLIVTVVDPELWRATTTLVDRDNENRRVRNTEGVERKDVDDFITEYPVT